MLFLVLVDFRALFPRHSPYGVVFSYCARQIDFSEECLIGTLGTSVIFCCQERSADEVQTIQLFHVLRPGREQVDAGGPNVGVAQDVRQLYDVSVDPVVHRREQVSQIVRKDLGGRYSRPFTNCLHLRPDLPVWTGPFRFW